MFNFKTALINIYTYVYTALCWNSQIITLYYSVLWYFALYYQENSVYVQLTTLCLVCGGCINDHQYNQVLIMQSVCSLAYVYCFKLFKLINSGYTLDSVPRNIHKTFIRKSITQVCSLMCPDRNTGVNTAATHQQP